MNHFFLPRFLLSCVHPSSTSFDRKEKRKREVLFLSGQFNSYHRDKGPLGEILRILQVLKEYQGCLPLLFHPQSREVLDLPTTLNWFLYGVLVLTEVLPYGYMSLEICMIQICAEWTVGTGQENIDKSMNDRRWLDNLSMWWRKQFVSFGVLVEQKTTRFLKNSKNFP